MKKLIALLVLAGALTACGHNESSPRSFTRNADGSYDIHVGPEVDEIEIDGNEVEFDD